jgi:hypothetical protein
MCFDKLRSIPEDRLSGDFGIPGAIINLSSATANSKTKGGRNDEREQAYENCMIPNNTILAIALTDGFLAEYADPIEYRVAFDYSNVRCLREDEDKLYARLEKACGGPFLTVDESRTKTGHKPMGGEYEKIREKQASKAAQTDDDLSRDKNEDIQEDVN